MKMKKKVLENPKFPSKEHLQQEFQFLMMNLLMLNNLIYSLESDIAWVLLSAVENNVVQEKLSTICIKEI